MSDWYLARKGVQFGPYTWEQLQRIAREGGLAAEDLLYSGELGEWTPAGQVAGLFGEKTIPPAEKKPAAAVSETGGEPAESTTGVSNQWYIIRRGISIGPYDWERILLFARQGELSSGDQLMHETGGQRAAVSSFPELAALLSQSPPGASRPGPVKKRKMVTLGLVGGAVILIAALAIMQPRSTDPPTAGSGAAVSGELAPLSADGEFAFGTARQDYYSPEIFEPYPDTESSFGTRTGTLSPESPAFQHEGVGIQLSSSFIEEGEEIGVEVTKMVAPAPIEGAKVNAYSFNLDKGSEYAGSYTITIPYSSDFDPGKGIIGAGYYNPERRQWDPVIHEMDEENNRIIITTDHLSTFSGIEVVIDENRPRHARLVTDWYFDIAASTIAYRYRQEYGAMLENVFKNNMEPGPQSIDVGRKVLVDWLDASGAILTLEGVAYSSEFLSNLSNKLGHLGTAMALYELANNYMEGEDQVMAINAFKTTAGFMIGKYGIKALQVSFIAVTAIDYSLNQLAEQLITAKTDEWEKAYRLYYQENHVRSMADWLGIIREIVSYAESPRQYKALIEGELERYASLFWKDEINHYHYMAKAKNGFTGITGGVSGLNEEMRSKISGKYKSELLYYLEPAFRQVEEELKQQQFADYVGEFRTVKKELNRTVILEIKETALLGEYQYAGYRARFAPLAEGVDPRMWTGRLDENGYLRGSFTVMSHLLDGAPHQLELYGSAEQLKAGTPEKVIDFEIDVPRTLINIEGVRVLIEGDREVLYELELGEREKTHHFSAVAVPEDSYRFVWDFGDGSRGKEDRGPGEKSTGSYTYENLSGSVTFEPRVELYDTAGELLATDSILIRFETLNDVTVDDVKEEDKVVEEAVEEDSGRYQPVEPERDRPDPDPYTGVWKLTVHRERIVTESLTESGRERLTELRQNTLWSETKHLFLLPEPGPEAGKLLDYYEQLRIQGEPLAPDRVRWGFNRREDGYIFQISYKSGPEWWFFHATTVEDNFLSGSLYTTHDTYSQDGAFVEGSFSATRISLD